MGLVVPFSDVWRVLKEFHRFSTYSQFYEILVLAVICPCVLAHSQWRLLEMFKRFLREGALGSCGRGPRAVCT